MADREQPEGMTAQQMQLSLALFDAINKNDLNGFSLIVEGMQGDDQITTLNSMYHAYQFLDEFFNRTKQGQEAAATLPRRPRQGQT
jgi:hypothetical protein